MSRNHLWICAYAILAVAFFAVTAHDVYSAGGKCNCAFAGCLVDEVCSLSGPGQCTGCYVAVEDICLGIQNENYTCLEGSLGCGQWKGGTPHPTKGCQWEEGGETGHVCTGTSTFGTCGTKRAHGGSACPES